VSTCISKYGEFSSHETDPVDFTCRLCFAFDETEAMAAAWDQGYRSGLSNAMRRMSDEPNAPTTPNPYRTHPTTTEPEGGER
jgi:hypothetical protein